MKEESTKKKGKTLWELFITFFKIGLFTFGGGYAMIPLIQRETVEKKGWVSEDDILEVVAIAESTPGPISVNAATFIGYRVKGVIGAFFATLGLVVPSFVIIFLISFVLRQFQEILAVQYAFWGIRAGVVALVVNACRKMAVKCPKKIVAYCIAGGAFLLSTFVDINVIFIIIACGLTGLIASLIEDRRAKK